MKPGARGTGAPVAIVAHDAGGAEILSSYCRRNAADYRYALGGPARRIFERKLDVLVTKSIDQALDGAGWLLCGTSWDSDIEVNAIRAARALAIESVVFLDHWVFYKERFTRGGVETLPDVLWVGDEIAERKARESFPDATIELVPNPYLQDINDEIDVAKRNVTTRTRRRGLCALYVAEPISEHSLRQFGDAGGRGYTEEDVLTYVASQREILGENVGELRIRPHPSEDPAKYAWAGERLDMPVSIVGGQSLIEEILDSDVVLGCQSMAMVVALIAGKRVISCIPPGGMPCTLPHRAIEHMQDLVAARRKKS